VEDDAVVVEEVVVDLEPCNPSLSEREEEEEEEEEREGGQPAARRSPEAPP
jgi:hypothetical protein